MFIQRLRADSTDSVTDLYKLGVKYNFITSVNCIEDSRWILNYYAANGVFVVDCYSKVKTYKYLDSPLSVYNSLE